MVFGKKRIHEVPSSDSDSDQNSASDEEIPQSLPQPKVKNSSTQSHSTNETTKPLLAQEVIYTGVTGKNPGEQKIGNANTVEIHSKVLTLGFTIISLVLHKGKVVAFKDVQLNDIETYKRIRKKVQEAEESGVTPSLKCSTLKKKEKGVCSKSLEEAFQLLERDVVDMKVMKGLCANGIPFNVMRNPQFVEMVMAINNGPKCYKHPSSEKARTVLLDECKRHVDKDLAPIKDTWFHQGVSIVSDGWSNVKHMPLINVLAVNSRAAMFLYADDFSGVEKTGVAIAEYLIKAIEEIRPSNVLQVVTDNVANCKAAGKEIQKVYKHIFCSPCVVHTLNLIFKDFVESFEWLRNTYKQGKTIVKYIINHSQVLAMYRANSKLELLKVAKTRFASHYLLLKRLLMCREALATTVVLNSWKEWINQGDENTRKIGALVAETIGPKMGEFYEKMDSMLGEIQEIIKTNKYANCYSEMETIITARWTKMNYTIHFLGFALTPRFYDTHYLSTPAPGGIARKALNQDKEVVTAVMQAFEKISENVEEQKLLRDHFATFHTQK
uniref:Uncharacterized protein LOC101496406 n=1 Tax=Cicer arietinum TaxID=3827 RepID=A0A1S2Z3B9_CICAR|nr:uncharacterized protein LOC101496406 [Cicer arietinum]